MQAVTGFTNGTAYRVRVRAVNADGNGAWEFSSGTPDGAVTALSVTAGDGKLDVSWTAPSGTLTGYDVHYTSAPATGTDAVANDATAGTDAVDRLGGIRPGHGGGPAGGDAGGDWPHQRHGVPGAGARGERGRQRRLGVLHRHAGGPPGPRRGDGPEGLGDRQQPAGRNAGPLRPRR